MQVGRITYDVTFLAETRRRLPFHAVYGTKEELFLETCDSRGVGGVGLFVKTNMTMNIESFEQRSIRKMMIGKGALILTR